MNVAYPVEIEIAPAKASDGQSDGFQDRPLLSIILPVRDSAGSLPATLNAITHWIARSTLGVEVVVIDDGSSDGTRATAYSFGRKIANLQVLRHVETRGRLEAIRTGETAANGELIAFGRAPDLTCALESFTDLIAKVQAGADVAILPAPPDRRTTPLPEQRSKRFTETCVDWLRSRMARPLRDPALVVCRTTALRKMITAARPDEGEPDWLALARRAKCTLSVVRPGLPSTPSRPLPAQMA